MSTDDVVEKAVSLSGLGQRAEALRLLEEVRARASDRADIPYWIGTIHEKNGDLTQAEREYRAAIELDPVHSRALNNCVSVLGRMEKYDEIKSLLDTALSLNPADPYALNNMGQYFFICQNDKKSAKKYYKQALKNWPAYARNTDSRTVDHGQRERIAKNLKMCE